MKLWLDAQLPPSMAAWMRVTFGVQTVDHVADLGLLGASDGEIFQAARAAGAMVASKDRDFVDLLDRHGPPPQVLWITCGNTSNTRLRQILQTALPVALALLEAGEPFAEVGAAGHE